MSGKPLTNISNGKTGDSWGLRASDAGLCAAGGGRAGLAEQGCGAAPGPGWPAQTLVGRVPGA